MKSRRCFVSHPALRQIATRAIILTAPLLLATEKVWSADAVEPNAAEVPANAGENAAPLPRLDSFAALEAAHPTPEGTKKAIQSLRKLGAIVSWVLWDTGHRTLSIVFRNRGEVSLPDDLPQKWQGTDADLKLLNDVVIFDPLDVMIDCDYVTPRAVSELSLDRPLGSLRLRHLTDQVASELTRLPSCRKLIVDHWQLSPAGTRSLASRAGEIPSLALDGVFDPEKPRRGPSDGDVAELAVLADLESLEIAGSSQLTPMGLKPLAGLKKLKHLKLRNCPTLNGSDLAGLAGAQSLEKLELAIGTGGAALATVARLGALEELSVEFYDLAPADVRPLARLTRLERLELQYAWNRPSGGAFHPHREQLGIALAEVAASLPRLQALVNNNDVAFMNPTALAAIAKSKSLENLSVTYALLDDESLAELGRLTTLRRLDLREDGYERSFTAEGLAHLAKLIGLEELQLRHCQIDAAGLATLRPLVKLKSLGLRASTCDDACCRVLSEVFPLLTSLELEGTAVTDAGIESLTRLADLDALNLTKAHRVTDASIPSLAKFKHLRRLDVGGIGLSDEGWQMLNRELPGVEITAFVD